MRLGLIGYGNIGRALADLVIRSPETAGAELRILARKGTETLHDTVHDVAALLRAPLPDLVVECAGHGAVGTFCPAVLEHGVDTVIASVGALADAHLHDRLRDAALRGNARMVLPAGAIGGLDLLSALRPSGIAEVVYEGRKPPAAWRGSAAETVLDLANLTEATAFFEGTAREAAQTYPKNANVTAAVALAGVGFDATRVRLIADPGTTGNLHSYTVVAGAARYRIEITGVPSPDMPRTSAATVLSLYREIRNRVGPVVI